MGSGLFHLLLFFAAFSRAAGDLVSASDAGGGPVFAVTLVRLDAPPEQDASEIADEGHLLKMQVRQAPEGLPLAAEPERERLSAFAHRLTGQGVVTASRPDARSRSEDHGAPQPSERSPSEARGDRATNLSSDGATAVSASTGALWGAIEPCWRNLGFRGQVPVTIEVVLNERGGLRSPPRVLRSPTALLSEPRLKSEANAMAALAACLPRGELRVAAASYRLEFPASQ